MQPYFFPYLGYFELIFRTNRWVAFDTAQYIRHGWVNRNRILHPNKGWQYIIAPVKKQPREVAINEVETTDTMEWRQKILGQLMHYKKHAPHYAQVIGLVEDCLSTDSNSLARLNVRILEKVCHHLEIPWNASLFSEMDLRIGPVAGPGDWALRISEALGANSYINPPGGADLFDPARFKELGINLTIQEPFEFAYQVKGYTFEPGLSVIDVLMWVSPEEVRQHLRHRALMAAQSIQSDK